MESWLERFLLLKRTVEAHVEEEETNRLARELLTSEQERNLARELEAEEVRMNAAA